MGAVRDDIVQTARQYLGVPFHHEGRHRSAGLDCVGLLIVVADDLGIPNQGLDYRYRIRSSKDTLRVALEENGVVPRPEGSEPRHGDILSFWHERRGVEYHVGIYATDNGKPSLIHTSGISPRKRTGGKAQAWTLGKVTEHGLNDYWWKRFVSVYQVDALEDV